MHRQELVEHYDMLMKEAKLREQRAEWRTKRLQLNDARKQLWQTEREVIGQEMEKLLVEKGKLSSLQPQSPEVSAYDHKGDHVIPSDMPPTDHLINEPASSDAGESLEQENVTSQAPLPLIEEPYPQPSKPLNTTSQDTIISMEIITEASNTPKVNVSGSSIQYDIESESISKPHVSDSVIQQVLHPTNDNTRVMEEFSKHLSPRQQPRRGVGPRTTIQDILYPSNNSAPAYHSTRGKPPPTTIQNLLYHFEHSGLHILGKGCGYTMSLQHLTKLIVPNH